MRLLIFDTETTSLPIWGKPSEDPEQPHIVELAAILVDTVTGREIEVYDRIVKPDGWTIPDEAAKIHGIDTERALAEGEPEGEVLGEFLRMASTASLIAGFGVDF